VGIELKGVEKFETDRACMISAECPAILAPGSAQPWPLFIQPRHKLVAGNRERRIGAWNRRVWHVWGEEMRETMVV